jgi:hypothetical protein
MKILHDFRKCRGGIAGLTAAVLAACLGMGSRASGQVVASADAGGLAISAGATGSGFELQYGERKMLGVSGFVDVDTRRRFGVEAEGRWLEFNQTADVHAETYSIGPRYHLNFGRIQPYAKGMIGIGEFNFPYNYAHGSYLVVTGGGGVDYHLKRRIYIRAADVEYQYWPQFTYGGMSSFGVSAGIRVRVF